MDYYYIVNLIINFIITIINFIIGSPNKKIYGFNIVGLILIGITFFRLILLNSAYMDAEIDYIINNFLLLWLIVYLIIEIAIFYFNKKNKK